MGIENPVHLLFLGAVALLVLGPKRLPELAKALGNGIREFRESISAGEDGEKAPVSPNGAPPAAAAGARVTTPAAGDGAPAPPPAAADTSPAPAPDAPPPGGDATSGEPQG
jgi:sec-independent protein translocase protein TatA